MGVTFRYLATESDGEIVPNWFSELANPPERVVTERGVVMYFRELGPLMGSSGPIDSKSSPLVNLVVPRRRRGVLLTAGEVHFLPTPLRKQFPALHKVSQHFGRWLGEFPCVFSRSSRPGEWDYFLEGSIRNAYGDVFALPGAMTALRGGHYFVSDADTSGLIDRLCKSLRLRGVEGILDAD